MVISSMSGFLSKLWSPQTNKSSIKSKMNKRSTPTKVNKVIPWNDQLSNKFFQNHNEHFQSDDTISIMNNYSKYHTTTWLQDRYDKYILKCIEIIQMIGTQTEGLFRISGNLAYVDDTYQKIISTDIEISIASKLENNIHNISSLLKKLLRLYPGGLIPEQALKAILSNRESQSLSFLKHVPDRNYNIIRMLFAFLSNISVDCVHMTLMDPLALSIVFAPNVASYDHIIDANELKQSYQLVQKIVERLIQKGIDDPCYWIV